MDVLVTGGTGYIGLNLVHTLVRSDHDVSVLVRESSPTEWLPDGVPTYEGDITDEDSVDQVVRESGCDAIVHLAAVHGRYSSAETEGALDESKINPVNVRGTQHVIDAADANSVDSVVFLSTTKAHPDIAVSDPAPYVESKIAAQQLFDEQSLGFEYATVNPTVVVGPHDYRLARYQKYQVVVSNRVLAPPLYKPIKINFVHMQDVVDSIVHFLQHPNDRENLISGENVSMKRYCEEIARTSDSSTWIVPTPYAHLYIPRLVDIGHRLGVFPISSDMFNWSDRTVPAAHTNEGPIDHRSLETIVRDTYSWYAEHELL